VAHGHVARREGLRERDAVHEVEWARLARSPGRSAGTRLIARGTPRDTGQLRGRHDLRDAREARGARSREVGQEVKRAVVGRGDAEDRRLPGRVRHAVGQVACGHAGLGDAPRAPLAEGAGICLARAEAPGRAGHAHAAGGEGVQVHAQGAGEEPHALLGRAVLARVAGGGVPGGGGGGAGSAGARSCVAARRAGAAAGRGPAVALRAGRGQVAGQIDAGDERYVHAGGSGRGIARPARVGRDHVDDAGRHDGDRRVRDRERRPEETVLDGLARAGGRERAAAIRVRCAGLVGVRAETGARPSVASSAAGCGCPSAGASARAVRAGETHGAGVRAAGAGPRVHTFAPRARPLGAVELAGPVAGDELTGTAYVEVGGGSGRGGAGRDRVGTAAADVQTGGTKIESLYRAGGVGVDRARERHGRGAREARPATTRRAGSRRVLEREARRCAGGAGRARRRAARRRGRRRAGRRRGRRRAARRRGRRPGARRRGRRRDGRRRGRRWAQRRDH